ncbi:MAG: hypothetical protein Phog2KO_42580 [Phototrophicaceae bacterium]
MVDVAPPIKSPIVKPSRFTWARLVSDIVSPPIVWAVLVVPVAFQYSQSTINAIFWAFLYGLFICLLPILYVAYHVWRGNISDIHMKNRRERIRPLLVSILCTTIVWWLLRTLGAPRAFSILAMMTLLQMTIIALITLSWQISMHTMSIAGAVVAIGIIFNISIALMFVPLVPLVAAARLNLKRHTPAQIIAGTVIGALLPVSFLGLLPINLLQTI